MAQTENKGPNALPDQSSVPPGSPSATTTIDGKYLPAPPPKFGGVINLSAQESRPFWAGKPWRAESHISH